MNESVVHPLECLEAWPELFGPFASAWSKLSEMAEAVPGSASELGAHCADRLETAAADLMRVNHDGDHTEKIQALREAARIFRGRFCN